MGSRTCALVACFLVACEDPGDNLGGATAGGSGSGLGGSGANGSGAGSGVGGDANVGGGGGGAAPPGDCDPLPAPAGDVIDVDPSQASSLTSIVFDAPAGATIRLAPGTYPVPSILQLRADGVTVRSQDDDPTSVVLDGGYTVPEIFQVTASDVTIAHLTITHAVDHLVHAFPPGDGSTITGLRLHGVHFIDSGEQFVKVNEVGDGGWVDDGRVTCSTFRMTDEGRTHVEPCCGGCYTGGIDAHAAWGWVVSQNSFDGIYCDNGGLAEHAVHFWKGSRDTLVENNVITDCARGIGFGLEGGTGPRVYPDNPYGGANLAHYDGIIRNNVIYADIDYFDTGIEADETRVPLIAHNTVITPGGAAFFSSIDYRFATTEVVIKNNLVDVITQRDGATGDVSNNLENTPLSYFVDAANVDFHLNDSAEAAHGAGTPVSDPGLDIDLEPHDRVAPDIGADEH